MPPEQIELPVIHAMLVIPIPVIDNFVQFIRYAAALRIEQKWRELRLEAIDAVGYDGRLRGIENVARRQLVRIVDGQCAQIGHVLAVVGQAHHLAQERERVQVLEHIHRMAAYQIALCGRKLFIAQEVAHQIVGQAEVLESCIVPGIDAPERGCIQRVGQAGNICGDAIVEPFGWNPLDLYGF